MNSFNSRAFLKAFFLTIIIGLILVCSINIIVDPFYRFNLFSIGGINLQRYQFSSNSRMGKAGAICRVNPTVILLGTSRVELGLDPHHRSFENERVYNLGLSGTGIQEMLDTFRHSIYADANLHKAIIALDFLLFNAYREHILFKTEVFDFDPKRLLHQPTDSCMKNFLYDADRLIGFKGLKYSFATIYAQQNPQEIKLVENTQQANVWTALYDANGFRGDNYEVLIPLAKNHGVKVFTKNLYDQEDYYIKKIWRASLSHRYCFVTPDQPNTLEVFKDLVDLAYESNVKIQFIINPIHARMLIAIQESGLWPQYEDWKRNLVKIIDEVAINHKKAAFPLWDFSGFNAITTESVPTSIGPDISKWFWEPSHYRKETGNLILDKISQNERVSSIFPDFGILLTQKNIELWLVKTRLLGRRYVEDHKIEMIDLKKHLSLQFNNNWIGSNCGKDIQAIRDGLKARHQGNILMAKYEFIKAKKIHEINKLTAQRLGVPDREIGFAKIIKEAQAGKSIDDPLESWQDYQDRGNTRAQKKDLTGALSDFTIALEEAPTNPALYFLRGNINTQLHDFKSAASDFQAGLKLDPQNIQLKKLLDSVNKKIYSN